MAEDYSWSWNAPDYGWGTSKEETPAFDFGADVDWGRGMIIMTSTWTG